MHAAQNNLKSMHEVAIFKDYASESCIEFMVQLFRKCSVWVVVQENAGRFLRNDDWTEMESNVS